MVKSNTSEDKDLSVCHVVNSIGETTGPANHALALQQHTPVDAGILGWFGATAFDEQEQIRTHCVNAPDTVVGIDTGAIRKAIQVLSQYDIVHTHHPHSATYAKVLARYLGLPIVFTYGTPSFRYTTKGRMFSGLTNWLADKVTCVSPAVRDTLKRWERWTAKEENIEVVYTGVNTEEIKAAKQIAWSVRDLESVPKSSLLVGHAGRLIDIKDQDILIKSVARANRNLEEDIYLLIAGDGEKRDELAQIAKDESFEDNVIFLGLIPREKVYKLMSELDVFAMPSKWEGFSSAAAEAMSVGTACVFSDIQAFREPFDGVARFHPVGDVGELSEILISLLSDTAAREKLGVAGQKRINQRFTIKKTAREYARIYRRIV